MDAVYKVLVEVAMFQCEDWSLAHVTIICCVVGCFMRFWETLFTTERWCHGKPFHFPQTPQLGKLLPDDQIGWKDMIFVNINSFIITAAYFTHLVLHLKRSNNFDSPFDGSSWIPPLSLPLQLLALFVIYDAVYVPFHRFLHLPEVYPWIHKHHHKTTVPHRGTFDGINAHPIEFVSGEYMHIFAIAVLELLLSSAGWRLHWWTVVSFVLCSSCLAPLNHTLVDVRIPGLFDPRDHGVHHKLLRANYFQYVKCWDMLYGSYYSGEDMIAKILIGKVN